MKIKNRSEIKDEKKSLNKIKRNSDVKSKNNTEQYVNNEIKCTDHIPTYDELEGLYGEEYLFYYGIKPPNKEGN